MNLMPTLRNRWMRKSLLTLLVICWVILMTTLLRVVIGFKRMLTGLNFLG